MSAAFALTVPGFAQDRVPSMKIRTTTKAHDPIRHAGAFIIAEAWRPLELDVTVKPLESRTLLDRFCTEQDFAAVIPGWSGRVERMDPPFCRGTLGSRHAGLGACNPGGCSNRDHDALVDARPRELDIEMRRDIEHAMQALHRPGIPVVILFHRNKAVACNTTAFANMNAMAGEGHRSE